MKIAQIAPLYESVPPKLYGGTERVVSYLTEELINMGHDVTLFASGDSNTKAKLVSPVMESLRLNHSGDPAIYHTLLIEKLLKMLDYFDIVHFHIDYIHFPTMRRSNVPHVTTLHGRLDIPDLVPLYKEFNDVPLVSISNSQRKPLMWANWVGTVHHGLPENLYKPVTKPGRYLAFLGRISPEKRPDRAIEIARKAGIELKIAAKVDKVDKDYYENVIKPLLKDKGVKFIGEINEKEKQDFLGNAMALLFPIDWPEPFGLVMIEALACGTPVIAFNNGSVPEIIKHGINGFIVNSTEEAIQCIEKLNTISREKCRETFEKDFTTRRMAQNYIEIYTKLLNIHREKAA